MTPKEKAEELIKKMDIDTGSWKMDLEQCKECALVCVNEIIKDCIKIREMYEDNNLINSDISQQPEGYWKEVKQEINKL